MRGWEFLSNKVYVGNLSWNLRDADLEQAFAEAGEVVSARVIMDRQRNRSKGFGFVEFATPEDAQKAIEMFDGKEIDGREVRVNEAQEQQPRD